MRSLSRTTVLWYARGEFGPAATVRPSTADLSTYTVDWMLSDECGI